MVSPLLEGFITSDRRSIQPFPGTAPDVSGSRAAPRAGELSRPHGLTLWSDAQRLRTVCAKRLGN